MTYERRSFSGSSSRTTITADITNSAVTIVIADGAGWPTGGAGPFYTTLEPNTASEETILVASRSALILTLASAGDRGEVGTVPIAHSSGAAIEHSYTSRDADEANYAVTQTVGKVVAKGDGLFGGAANTLVKVAVGTNGQMLFAESSAPAGVAYGPLPDGAVSTTAKLADGIVTTPKLADNAVTTVKVTDSQITTAKLAADAVTTVKILAANVTTAKIADANVTTAKIADANVTTDKIADGAVTTAKILDANVTTAKILDANVTTAKIADDAVTAAKLAPAIGLGFVTAPVTLVSDQTGITTATDIVSITWTADAARTYRIVGQTEVFEGPTATGNNLALLQITTTGNAEKGRTPTDTVLSTSTPRLLRAEAIETGLSGSTTRKLVLTRNSGTGQLTARGVTTSPKYISVEDMGAL